MNTSKVLGRLKQLSETLKRTVGIQTQTEEDLIPIKSDRHAEERAQAVSEQKLYEENAKITAIFGNDDTKF